jgi:hypothetical protein
MRELGDAARAGGQLTREAVGRIASRHDFKVAS